MQISSVRWVARETVIIGEIGYAVVHIGNIGPIF